jgi:hypothetical protein
LKHCRIILKKSKFIFYYNTLKRQIFLTYKKPDTGQIRTRTQVLCTTHLGSRNRKTCLVASSVDHLLLLSTGQKRIRSQTEQAAIVARSTTWRWSWPRVPPPAPRAVVVPGERPGIVLSAADAAARADLEARRPPAAGPGRGRPATHAAAARAQGASACSSCVLRLRHSLPNPNVTFLFLRRAFRAPCSVDRSIWPRSPTAHACRCGSWRTARGRSSTPAGAPCSPPTAPSSRVFYRPPDFYRSGAVRVATAVYLNTARIQISNQNR